MAALLERAVLQRVVDALAAVPVVIVEGPRASGKTSIGSLLRGRGHVAVQVDLGDPTILAAARSSPTAFIDGLPAPAFIDEVQLVPDLLLAVKRRVDRDRTVGLFVLSGSSRLGRTQLGGSDPLAGRAVRVRVWPMTQSELAGAAKNVVAELVAGAPQTGVAYDELADDDLLDRVRRGGLPTLAGVTAPITASVRTQMAAEYVEAVLYHEVTGRQDRSELLRLFRYLAGSTARLLNLSSVSSELSMTRESVANRLSSLEASFLIHLLPGHRPAEHRTLTAHPKVHTIDTALASWAARLDTAPAATVLGGLVESFVVNELCAQAAFSQPGLMVRHWRDTTRKLEVDAVIIDDRTGRSIGIEVKSSRDVRSDDLRGLRHYLANVNGAERGIVLYRGALTLQLADSIWAVPISALW